MSVRAHAKLAEKVGEGVELVRRRRRWWRRCAR